MKPGITRREFVGASMAARLSLGPSAQERPGKAGAVAAPSPPKLRAASPTGTRHYEGVELTILTHSGHSYLRAVEALGAEFRALTGATIKIKGLPSPHGWWALVPLAQADAVSKNPQFDLFVSDLNHTWTLWPHLQPLNDYIKKFEYDMRDFIAPVYKDGEAVQRGVRYGLPIRVNVPVVFYRKDLIGELPRRWDEYDKALAATTGGNRFGLSVVGASYPFHPHGPAEEFTKAFLARYWSLGASILSPDRKPRIAGEQGVVALEMLKRQVSRYASPESTNWDATAAGNAFLEGRAAIIESTPMRLLPRLDDPTKSKVAGNWAIGAYPGNSGGFLSMQEMAIFKHSRNREAAFEFLAYCTNPTAAARLLADYSETTARRTPWLDKPPGPRTRIVNALDRGITFAAGLPQWLDLLIALWEATSYTLQGYLTAKQALTLAAARWEASLAQDAHRWQIRSARE